MYFIYKNTIWFYTYYTILSSMSNMLINDLLFDNRFEVKFSSRGWCVTYVHGQLTWAHGCFVLPPPVWSHLTFTCKDSRGRHHFYFPSSPLSWVECDTCIKHCVEHQHIPKDTISSCPDFRAFLPLKKEVNMAIPEKTPSDIS